MPQKYSPRDRCPLYVSDEMVVTLTISSHFRLPPEHPSFLFDPNEQPTLFQLLLDLHGWFYGNLAYPVSTISIGTPTFVFLSLPLAAFNPSAAAEPSGTPSLVALPEDRSRPNDKASGTAANLAAEDSKALRIIKEDCKL